MSTDRPTIIKLPTIAFRRPPPSDPGAGVSLVNNVMSKAANPFENKTNNIQSNAIKPKDIANIDNVKPIRFVRRRLLYKAGFES
jgi:hypothetical protein